MISDGCRKNWKWVEVAEAADICHNRTYGWVPKVRSRRSGGAIAEAEMRQGSGTVEAA